MKRIWKTIIITAIICCAALHIMVSTLLLVFGISYGRFYYYLETRPDAQEDTVWSSEDGKILIYVEDFCNKSISFDINGFVTKCYFTSGRDYYADVYSMETFENNMLYPEEHYERWAYIKVKKDYFTVKVEKTKFLEEGQEITFYKTGQSVDGAVCMRDENPVLSTKNTKMAATKN